MTYSLSLYQGQKQSNTALYERLDPELWTGWRRSIRDVGGFWIGEIDYHGPESALYDLFLHGLGYEIRERAGSVTTWEGFIGQLELTLGGQTYTRTLDSAANKIRAIYSKIGDNLIANPGLETGAWAAHNAPTTNTRVTTWRTQGDYGAHIVANADGSGARIHQGAITEEVRYQARVSVEIISGTWTFSAVMGGTTLDSSAQSTTGRYTLAINFAPTSSGTVNLYLTGTAAGEVYADAAVLQTAPERTETEWFENTDAQDRYGVIEEILLLPGCTDDYAEARCKTSLTARAWPQTRGPGMLEAGGEFVTGGAPVLHLTCYGYAYTLAWSYYPGGDTAPFGESVETLITGAGGAEFLDTVNYQIEANAATYQIDQRFPVTRWDAIEEIIRGGDASGNRWHGGVYADRRFRYAQVPARIAYRYRGGRLYHQHGVPVDGPEVRPGYVLFEDMPVGPSPYDLSGGALFDNPRVLWMNEVEFIAPDTVRLSTEV